MDAYLWTQSTSPTIPDSFIINGTKQEDSLTEEQQEVFQQLLEYAKMEGKNPSEVEKLRRRGKIDSNEFKIILTDDSIFFQGHYTTPDESGRKIPFMFLCFTDNIQDAIRRWKDDSQKIGRAISEKDKKAYEDIAKQPTKENRKEWGQDTLNKISNSTGKFAKGAALASLGAGFVSFLTGKLSRELNKDNPKKMSTIILLLLFFLIITILIYNYLQ